MTPAQFSASLDGDSHSGLGVSVSDLQDDRHTIALCNSKRDLNVDLHKPGDFPGRSTGVLHLSVLPADRYGHKQIRMWERN
jgi:hypothetical protein